MVRSARQEEEIGRVRGKRDEIKLKRSDGIARKMENGKKILFIIHIVPDYHYLAIFQMFNST